jgi:hypothetical protein
MDVSGLTAGDRRFVETHPHAAMITVGADGRPKAVKMEAAVIDGRPESTSHADKVRTVRLQRDLRCTLYVADDEHRWLSLEADVEIVAGPDAPARWLRYVRVRDGKPAEPLDHQSDRSHYTGLDGTAFPKVMAEEDAVLHRFTVTRAYGNR